LQNLNVVINLDKPEGISSQQAVTKVKRLFGAKKAGHAGTLDPLATGVLVVCLNEATKITRFLMDLDKEYAVRVKLGERTDTYDSTGRTIEYQNYQGIKESDIRKMLPALQGRIRQTPPMYSAIKMQGRTLYKLARKGITLDVPEREVTISGIEFIAFDPPFFDLVISCSKGTYIRSFCNDLGNALGVGAHMTALKRTKAGMFGIEEAVSIEQLEARQTLSLHSIDASISHLKEIILDPEAYRKAKNGAAIHMSPNERTDFVSNSNIPPEQLAEDVEGEVKPDYVRLKSPEHVLFGIGKIEGDRIKIERLLN
jgi:tRNA pseudouridine55 synthase